jgi:hypothetical protein
MIAMHSQNKKWLIAVVAILVAAVVFQTSVSSLAFFRVRSQTHARLQAVVENYQALDEHVQALIFASVSDAERDAVRELEAAIKTLPGTDTTGSVTQVQAALSRLFGRTDLSPELQANEHFALLNKELSGNGNASPLLREYNKSVAELTNVMQTKTGKILSSIVGQEPMQPLYPDGRPREVQTFL